MYRHVVYVIAFVMAVAAALPALAADPFAGSFTGPQLSIDLAPAGGSYTGSIHLGEQVFPMTARANGNQISGSFTSQNRDYPFTATITGDDMMLVSGTTTYHLTRQPAAVPLPPATTPPPAPNAAIASATPSDVPRGPAGYSIAGSTDVGKIWVARKAGISTVTAGLQGAIADLATFFGNQPIIKGAFEDTRDHKSGAASFTASADGKPVNGLVTCKLATNEAQISVTYCLATASAADWAQLNSDATPRPPAPQIKLNRVNFPDNTGSVGIADGWTLHSASAVDPLYVTGPADQVMGAASLGYITIVSPDSPRIRQYQQQRQQLEDSFRRLNRPPPPPPPNPFPIVAAFAPPDQALPIVMPQVAAMRAAQRQETITLDRITAVKPMPPGQPGWTTQLLEYDQTRLVNGQPTHFHVRCTWSSMPPGASMTDQWGLTPLGNMGAPVATFDKDVIVMEAMSKSIQVNWDTYLQVDEARFKARLAANQIAYDERYRQQEAQQVANLKAYDEHNRQWAIYENQKSRNAADWIEYAGGYRTVIDTQTGERTKVDLSNVNGIVDGLNAESNDPHRFVQIPLRDERNPIGEPMR